MVARGDESPGFSLAGAPLGKHEQVGLVAHDSGVSVKCEEYMQPAAGGAVKEDVHLLPGAPRRCALTYSRRLWRPSCSTGRSGMRSLHRRAPSYTE